MTVDERLAEWSECRGTDSTGVGFAPVNFIGRIMDQGVDGASGVMRGSPSDKMPDMVQRLARDMERTARVNEIEQLYRILPPELRDVARLEYLEGVGRSVACRQLNWTQSQWRDKRSGLLYWLRAMLYVLEVAGEAVDSGSECA